MLNQFRRIGNVVSRHGAGRNRHAARDITSANQGRAKRPPADCVAASAHWQCQQLEKRVLLSSTLGATWMAGVSDNMRLTQMSIPGTHDTMTGSASFTESDLFTLVNNKIDKYINDAIPGWLEDGYYAATFGGDLRGDLDAVANSIVDTLAFPFLPLVQHIATTQDYTLQQQLDEGVRALDIRVQQTNDQLIDVHGALPIGDLHFVPDVMQVAANFLQQNPSETIIMQVQEDSVGPNNSENFDQVFQQSIAPFSNYVWQPTAQEPVPATLGEARGKIVFVQSGWSTPDPNYPTQAIFNLNSDGSLASGAPAASSQDDFDTADLNQKYSEAKATLDYAAANLTGQTAPSTFVANYLSTNHILGLFSTSASYPFPINMATGDTLWFNINLPTSVDGAIADLTGNFITLDSTSGPGMNSLVDSYINSEPRNAPTGVVFTDFADTQPNFVQDIYSHNARIKVNPVNITYGATLANNQLTGTVTQIINDQSVPVSGTFSYTSAAGTLLSAGNGQTESVTFTPDDLTDYSPIITSVIVNVAQATPTLSIAASPVVVLGTGTKLTAQATLASGFGETGQILFTLIGPGGTPVDTETASVGGNGAYSTPSGFAPTAAGQYQWIASYSGDGNNKPAATTLGAAPQVAVGRGVTVVNGVLYLVGNAGSDQLNIQHLGASNTGSTGIRVIGQLNGVNVSNLFNPAPASIYSILFDGNDLVTMEPNLAVPAVVIAGNGNDLIQLAQGNNSVAVGNGRDQIQAGNGNNTIVANTGAGQVQINLGNGNNSITVTDSSLGSAAINLGDGNNSVTVGDGQDRIQAGSGSNTIIAGNGNDAVNLGNGDFNNVSLGNGNDSVNIGNGSNETVVVGNGRDSVNLGNGSNDNVTIGLGVDRVQIGKGDSNTVFAPLLASPLTQIKFGPGTGDTIVNF